MKNRTPLRLLTATLAATLLSIAPAAWSQELQEFTARYQVRFYGISGGQLQLKLTRGSAANEYVYESSADPSLLGGLVISSGARERCLFQVDGTTIKPLKFDSDDGKKGDEKDSHIEYDWAQNRLIGRSEQVDFNQELPPRIQDHMSIQIAVILALRKGEELGTYSLLDGGEVKRFAYTKEGEGTVKLKNRTLNAVIVRSARADDQGGRVTRYWHAPELDFLPVRAERSRNGKIDLTMELVDLIPAR